MLTPATNNNSSFVINLLAAAAFAALILTIVATIVAAPIELLFLSMIVTAILIAIWGTASGNCSSRTMNRYTSRPDLDSMDIPYPNQRPYLFANSGYAPRQFFGSRRREVLVPNPVGPSHHQQNHHGHDTSSSPVGHSGSGHMHSHHH